MDRTHRGTGHRWYQTRLVPVLRHGLITDTLFTAQVAQLGHLLGQVAAPNMQGSSGSARSR
jgi:hypothetical protein